MSTIPVGRARYGRPRLPGGERGYILDFSNRSFSEFFALELDVGIGAEIYKREGTPKGKRLRGLLTIVVGCGRFALG